MQHCICIQCRPCCLIVPHVQRPYITQILNEFTHVCSQIFICQTLNLAIARPLLHNLRNSHVQKGNHIECRALTIPQSKIKRPKPLTIIMCLRPRKRRHQTCHKGVFYPPFTTNQGPLYAAVPRFLSTSDMPVAKDLIRLT